MDQLPPEIVAMVLYHLSDLKALKALVHASPRCHQVYLDRRPLVLTTVLERDIGPSLLDAWAAHQAGSLEFSSTSYLNVVGNFIQNCSKARRRDEPGLPFLEEPWWRQPSMPNSLFFLAWPAVFTVDQLISLAKHQRFVDAACTEYCSSALICNPIIGERNYER